MKIGVLAAGYNCSEYFEQVMAPWIEYKNTEQDHQIIISGVHAHFKGNETSVKDNSRDLMVRAYDKKYFDYVIFPLGEFEEKDARNLALQPLLQENVGCIILLDLQDEIYTLEQIKNIFTFVEQNPFAVWFSINFKNYVGDNKHYVENFCPPRIFRTRIENVVLSNFYYDNDIIYRREGEACTQEHTYKAFSSILIPKNLAFVKHYSWCGSPYRLKEKIAYQLKHFNGICSYKWDNETNQVVLDPEFYFKFKIPMPTIYKDV